MSFTQMDNDYLDYLAEEEPPCEKCKHDTGTECAIMEQGCHYEENTLSELLS